MVHDDLTQRLRPMPQVGKKRVQEPSNTRRLHITELSSVVNSYRSDLKQIRAHLFKQKDYNFSDLKREINRREERQDTIQSEEAFINEL